MRFARTVGTARGGRAYAAGMIIAMHTLVYADDAEAARAFFRDVLDWPHVDAGEGWLIFGTGPSELGVHPTTSGEGEHRFTTNQHQELTLMCDDLRQTVKELEAKGAKFTGEVREAGFGLIIQLQVPGAGELMLYEPRHPVAYEL